MPRVSLQSRRRRSEIARRQLPKYRAAEYPREGTILVELAVDALRCACQPQIAQLATQHPNERALESIALRSFVPPQYTGRNRAPFARQLMDSDSSGGHVALSVRWK